MNKLYRALREDEIDNDFTLIPKNLKEFIGGLCPPFTVPATPGMTVINAIKNHQTNSNTFPTRGISTTTEYKVACEYAKNNKYIAIINRDSLKSNSISEYVVKDHIHLTDVNKPKDEEVILVSENDGIYPKKIIHQIVKL